MGIHVYFYRVTSEKIDEIKDDEERIWNYLEKQDNIEDNEKDLWVEKAWEGIYYLLYNKTWFKSQVMKGTLLGGTILNESFIIGYGSPIVQYPQEVKKIKNRLLSFTELKLREKFDPKQFSALKIYPNRDNWEKNAEENFDYLVFYWKKLCEFYQKAVNEKELMLVYWS